MITRTRPEAEGNGGEGAEKQEELKRHGPEGCLQPDATGLHSEQQVLMGDAELKDRPISHDSGRLWS